jgi:hypothetical protein
MRVKKSEAGSKLNHVNGSSNPRNSGSKSCKLEFNGNLVNTVTFNGYIGLIRYVSHLSLFGIDWTMKIAFA